MRRTVVIVCDLNEGAGPDTRFIPPLDRCTAERLERCFLLDTVEKASAVPDAEVAVAGNAMSSPELRRVLHACAASRNVRQATGLESLFAGLWESGRSVLMMGIYTPTLPARCLELAFDALASTRFDIVIGPSSGGRCYLTGMNRPLPDILPIEGGSSAVALAAKASARGLRAYILPEWHDFRAASDLAWLKSELLDRTVTHPSARHTRAILHRLIREGCI